MIEFLHK